MTPPPPVADAAVSVVVATYNHAQFLPRCLSGLLAQTARPSEIIVVDDASTDETGVLLAEHARLHSNIRVITNPENLGVCRAFNAGIDGASMPAVYCAAADDYTLPTALERLAGALDGHPQASLAVGMDSHQYGDGPVYETWRGDYSGPTYLPPDGLSQFLRQPIPGHAVLIRTESLRAAGGFRPPLRWFSDWFAWLVAAFRTGLVYVPDRCAVRVLRPEAYSVAAKDRGEHAAVLAAIEELIGTEFSDVAHAFRHYQVLEHLRI